jgi:hypothetical protein
MAMSGARIRGAVGRWLRRYLPAELICTPCALLAGGLTAELTGSSAAAALAATWGENLGFYGMMLGRELTRRGGFRALPAAARDLFVEFGPAEALDSFLLRPAALYVGIAVAPAPVLGVLVGKLVADLGFYAPAILTHELQRRFARATA